MAAVLGADEEVPDLPIDMDNLLKIISTCSFATACAACAALASVLRSDETSRDKLPDLGELYAGLGNLYRCASAGGGLGLGDVPDGRRGECSEIGLLDGASDVVLLTLVNIDGAIAAVHESGLWRFLWDFLPRLAVCSAAGGARGANEPPGLISPTGLSRILAVVHICIEQSPRLYLSTVCEREHALGCLVGLLDDAHLTRSARWRPDPSLSAATLVVAVCNIFQVIFAADLGDALYERALRQIEESGLARTLVACLRGGHLGPEDADVAFGVMCPLALESADCMDQFVTGASGEDLARAFDAALDEAAVGPDAVLDTLALLAQIARSSGRHRPFLEGLGLLPRMAGLIGSGETDVRARACSTLGNLFKASSSLALAFCSGPGPGDITSLLADGESEVRKFAAFALGNAALQHEKVCQHFAPGISSLVELLGDGCEKTRANAAAAIGNMARRGGASLHGGFVASGAPASLLEVATHRKTPVTVQQSALYALSTMCKDGGLLICLRDLNAGTRLSALAVSDPSSLKHIKRTLARLG